MTIRAGRRGGSAALGRAPSAYGRLTRYVSICLSASVPAVDVTFARVMETMPALKPATSAAMPIDMMVMAISSSISVMPVFRAEACLQPSHRYASTSRT